MTSENKKVVFLFNLFNHLFELTEFDHRFSSLFIFFISKVTCPSNLNDFRTILLLGWIHNVIVRVLASRLK